MSEASVDALLDIATHTDDDMIPAHVCHVLVHLSLVSPPPGLRNVTHRS